MNPSKLLASLISAGPYFYLALRYWNVWQDPSLEGGEWLKMGIIIFNLEFIIAFSGVFMAGLVAKGPASHKIIATVVFYVLFGFFVYPMSLLTLGSKLGWSVIGIYSTLMLTRLINGLVINDDSAAEQAKRSAIGYLFVYVALFLSTSGHENPIWPVFGFQSGNGADPLEGWRLWVPPHRTFGAGFVYFSITGLLPILFALLPTRAPNPEALAFREARETMKEDWLQFLRLKDQLKHGTINQQEYDERRKKLGY